MNLLSNKVTEPYFSIHKKWPCCLVGILLTPSVAQFLAKTARSSVIICYYLICFYLAFVLLHLYFKLLFDNFVDFTRAEKC